jgi:putative acetyltransferase
VPGLSLIALDGSALVGHILLSRVDLVDDADRVAVARREVLALGPLAVAPARQRQGIGSLLIAAAIDRAEALGEPLIVVLGHADYYPRFGFVPASELSIMPPAGMPEDHYFARPLAAYDESFRGRVVYGPEWAV